MPLSLASPPKKLLPWTPSTAWHWKLLTMRLKMVSYTWQDMPKRTIRKLLTTCFILSAGLSTESLRGSQTAVYGCSMTQEYQTMLMRDMDAMPRQAATGIVQTLLPNRISWYFDLHGPSVFVDSACSSSMAAIDMACQAMASGDATAVSYIPSRSIGKS